MACKRTLETSSPFSERISAEPQPPGAPRLAPGLPRARHALALAAALGLSACGGSALFPLKEPLREDPDKRPFAAEPEEYYSPFAWDAANQSIFRPISRFFAVDPAGTAENVNALDEVPNSSWFEGRLGVHPMSAAEITRGACSDRQLDPKMPDGSWVVDKGKDNGANPGFRVNIKGFGKFMLKSDSETEPDRATGATAIASRVYHAVGYYAPCDTIVYFRRSLLKLTPGLTVTNNQGVTRPFDQARLNTLLDSASERNGLVRMVASEWLPGKPLGPYRYDGRRSDDPNDIIYHEDRRELRGGKLVAAWLGHFDSREQNTLDVFMPAEDKKGGGYIRHYIIDMGDSFGSVWSSPSISKRLNHAYMLDIPYMTEDFLTLGVIERPWDRARDLGNPFHYFSARDFNPEVWRGEYPNPAFSKMQEGDGAWMARILARFNDELLTAAVKVGKYEPEAERFLIQTLISRRNTILRRYLGRLSPISDVEVTKTGLCAVDLARVAGIVPNEAETFRALSYRGENLKPSRSLRLLTHETPRVCVELPHADVTASVPDGDPRRYAIVELHNGFSRGPLRAHLYDLGPERGYQLVGIERPDKWDRN